MATQRKQSSTLSRLFPRCPFFIFTGNNSDHYPIRLSRTAGSYYPTCLKIKLKENLTSRASQVLV